jgi:hypothetical protein
MPSNYVGVPTAVETPAAAPGYGVAVTVALPIDAEPANASSVAQPFKVLADWVAWARDKLGIFHGITLWDSARTFATGDVALDPSDEHLYRAKQQNANQQPSASAAAWDRIDWTLAELQALTVKVATGYGEATASNGASPTAVTMFSYSSNSVRRIELAVGGVPASGNTIVDLSGCDQTKFATSCRSAQATILSSDFGYGGQVGLNLAVDGNPNRILIWTKKGAGDGRTSYNVGLSLLGV